MNKMSWIENSEEAWTFGIPTPSGHTIEGQVWLNEEKYHFSCTSKYTKKPKFVPASKGLQAAKDTVEAMVRKGLS